MDKQNRALFEAEIEAELSKINIELVDLQYRKESGDMVLRIFIDNDEGVKHETCAYASRAVKTLLDERDFYYDSLEVSSPGLDRVLKKDKDFERFLGTVVKISLSEKYEDRRRIIGRLLNFDNEFLKVESEDVVFDLPRNIIAQVRLHPIF